MPFTDPLSKLGVGTDGLNVYVNPQPETERSLVRPTAK